MDLYTVELLARQRQQDLLREAAEQCKVALLPGTSARERLAGVLMALTARLDPVVRDTAPTDRPLASSTPS